MSGPCAKQVVTATLVLSNGLRFVGENDCRTPQTVCPRGDMPSGVGYELCKSVCNQTGHAEENAIQAALDEGWFWTNALIYVEGHTYVCEACQKAAAKNNCDLVLGPPPA